LASSEPPPNSTPTSNSSRIAAKFLEVEVMALLLAVPGARLRVVVRRILTAPVLRSTTTWGPQPIRGARTTADTIGRVTPCSVASVNQRYRSSEHPGSLSHGRGRGRGGLGEVRVFLVPLPAAAKDRDAEEVQQRQAGVHRQAHARGGHRDQDGEQIQGTP